MNLPPEPRMNPVLYRRQRFRRGLLILLIPHAVMGWLFLVSYVGMVAKIAAWSDYGPAMFVVSGYKDYNARRGARWSYLRGVIAGREEDYNPPGHLSLADLQQQYPTGTAIEVLYDPNGSRTFVQGQTLRVITRDGLTGALRFVIGYTIIFVLPWSAFAYLVYVRSSLLFRATPHGLEGNIPR